LIDRKLKIEGERERERERERGERVWMCIGETTLNIFCGRFY